MPLNPRDLDYFLEVARHAQLTQAAVGLDVTVPALSKAIRRLETETGMALFERGNQGMRLTPFGASFAERARRIKTEHDAALQYAGDVRAGRAGLLRIGATIAVLDSLVSPALARVQPRRPGMHAVLVVAASGTVLEQTRQGALDASVVPVYQARPHELEQEALCGDELVPIARAHHPVFERRRLTIKDVAAFDWILPRTASAARGRLDAIFQAAGIAPPNAAVEVEFSASWSVPLVAATDMLALVPRSMLERSASAVRIVELAPLRLPRTIGLFRRPGTYLSPLMTEVIEALRWAANR